MTIILDFDDVLFDTASFKKALAKIFEKHKADFWKTYEQAKKSKGVYSIKKFGEDINKIDFKQFLFPDVLKFLKTFKKDNDIILLSWGEKKFQEKKIYGLGQEFISLFDKIITGPTEKADVLSKLLNIYKSRPVVFIDNSPQELKKIKDNFKDIVLVKITRRRGQGLKQVEKICKQLS